MRLKIAINNSASIIIFVFRFYKVTVLAAPEADAHVFVTGPSAAVAIFHLSTG